MMILIKSANEERRKNSADTLFSAGWGSMLHMTFQEYCESIPLLSRDIFSHGPGTFTVPVLVDARVSLSKAITYLGNKRRVDVSSQFRNRELSVVEEDERRSGRAYWIPVDIGRNQQQVCSVIESMKKNDSESLTPLEGLCFCLQYATRFKVQSIFLFKDKVEYLMRMMSVDQLIWAGEPHVFQTVTLYPDFTVNGVGYFPQKPSNLVHFESN